MTYRTLRCPLVTLKLYITDTVNVKENPGTFKDEWEPRYYGTL